MKKIIFLIFTLLLTSNILYSQETADVNVTTTVQSVLVLTPTNINLGGIQEGIASYLDANTNDTGTEVNIGSTAQPGSLQIQGSAGASVMIEWTTATLTDNVGNNPATFTPTFYNGVSVVTSGGNVVLTGGDITLDIGGGLTAISTTGLFSTSHTNGSPITITIQYN
jgi:hypothetical protein